MPKPTKPGIGGSVTTPLGVFPEFSGTDPAINQHHFPKLSGHHPGGTTMCWIALKIDPFSRGICILDWLTRGSEIRGQSNKQGISPGEVFNANSGSNFGVIRHPLLSIAIISQVFVYRRDRYIQIGFVLILMEQSSTKFWNHSIREPVLIEKNQEQRSVNLFFKPSSLGLTESALDGLPIYRPGEVEVTTTTRKARWWD